MGKNTIIGTFDGECADANITNLNGLDITREVWEEVFNSDEYKHAIEQGWYIGYLGHPEDPDCQDFEHACIVMTEGYIDDDNKIYGAFNLIDTPVGRIVKSFIDAGVQFGISVRGAGDITNNSVDPGSFIFRGFDLVTFPAYPNSIPEFQEIAASTNLAKRAKYRKVCATIKANIDDIPLSSIDVLQTQFAPKSQEYEMLEERKKNLEATDIIDKCEFSDKRLEALMDMYLTEKNSNRELSEEIVNLNADIEDLSAENRKLSDELQSTILNADRRADSIENMLLSQQDDLTVSLDEEIAANTKLKSEIKALKSRVHNLQLDLDKEIKANQSIKSSVRSLKADKKVLQDTVDSLDDELNTEITANSKLQRDIDRLKSNLIIAKDKLSETEDKLSKTTNRLSDVRASLSAYKREYSDIDEANSSLFDALEDKDNEIDRICSSIEILKDENKNYKDEIKSLNSTNLIYKGDIDKLKSQLESKDDVIASLRDELAKTVSESEDAIDETSNLEDQIKILAADITAANKLIADYQQAYASLYAHAVGIEVDSLSISANASVSELQKSIQNLQPDYEVQASYDSNASDDIITM